MLFLTVNRPAIDEINEHVRTYPNMSLPQQLLSAQPFTLPQWPEKLNTTFAEPITLKQIPLAQMERLLDQLSSLSAYANHMFLDIANQTLYLQSRLDRVTSSLETLKDNVPTELPPLEPVSKRTAWTGDHSITSNLFTKATLPASLLARYQKCQPAPNLAVLDKFRFDGLPCMRVSILNTVLLVPGILC
jgi:hypothetical protein